MELLGRACPVRNDAVHFQRQSMPMHFYRCMIMSSDTAHAVLYAASPSLRACTLLWSSYLLSVGCILCAGLTLFN